MELCDYLDKGASLGADAPCLTTGEHSLSYGAVQELSHRIAAALTRSGVVAGETVAILSANDPTAFTTVFALSRIGAVWSPINPRSEASENQELLARFECTVLLYQAAFSAMVAAIRPGLPRVRTFVCLDGDDGVGVPFATWLAGAAPSPVAPVDPAAPVAPSGPAVPDLAMIVGTGGTTGAPKGVMLTSRNLETMSAIVLMSYPFRGRPVYLALPPLTHAAGVLCFPILARGGQIVIMPRPDIHAFLPLVARHGVTHAFLPPTLIYLLLDEPGFEQYDVSSLQCLWYGAAPMSTARLAQALQRLGPVMGQLFGQTEAPMMISTLSPAEHFNPDGTVATQRLASAGRAAPLVTVAVMAEDGTLLPAGERGELVVRSSLVMAGYFRDPAATAAVGRHGWHHTGDIGYLDPEGYLFIVDRAKDVIITGGFNVYSAEVEQAIMRFPGVLDCAVVGLPDPKWGEAVTAVIQGAAGAVVDLVALREFVRTALGGVKAPKRYESWSDLPRSKVGKVLKSTVKERLLAQA